MSAPASSAAPRRSSSTSNPEGAGARAGAAVTAGRPRTRLGRPDEYRRLVLAAGPDLALQRAGHQAPRVDARPADPPADRAVDRQLRSDLRRDASRRVGRVQERAHLERVEPAGGQRPRRELGEPCRAHAREVRLAGRQAALVVDRRDGRESARADRRGRSRPAAHVRRQVGQGDAGEPNALERLAEVLLGDPAEVRRQRLVRRHRRRRADLAGPGRGRRDPTRPGRHRRRRGRVGRPGGRGRRRPADRQRAGRLRVEARHDAGAGPDQRRRQPDAAGVDVTPSAPASGVDAGRRDADSGVDGGSVVPGATVGGTAADLTAVGAPAAGAPSVGWPRLHRPASRPPRRRGRPDRHDRHLRRRRDRHDRQRRRRRAGRRPKGLAGGRRRRRQRAARSRPAEAPPRDPPHLAVFIARHARAPLDRPLGRSGAPSLDEQHAARRPDLDLVPGRRQRARLRRRPRTRPRCRCPGWRRRGSGRTGRGRSGAACCPRVDSCPRAVSCPVAGSSAKIAIESWPRFEP